MFYQNAYQSLKVFLKRIKKESQYEISYSELIANLKKAKLLGKKIVFANSGEFGKFLVGQQKIFKANIKSFKKSKKQLLAKPCRRFSVGNYTLKKMADQWCRINIGSVFHWLCKTG